MKTVKIPTIGENPCVVTVNNVKYSYPAGATVSVPDEVAAVIENNIRLMPVENPPEQGDVNTFRKNAGTWETPDKEPKEGSGALVLSSGVSAAIRQAVKDRPSVIVETVTGSSASFTDGAKDFPCIDVTAAITAVQSGEGDPSSANIRPISGWDAVKVSHSGADTTAAVVETILLPVTVYGGTLDVTTGVLTATRGYIASYNGETLPGEWISDRDVYAAGTTPTTGAQVVYTLAESVAYQVEPVEIKTLLGVNNIWADAGNVTVQYAADAAKYVEKVTTPVYDWTAESNISDGEYFMVSDRLFLATDAIASGEEIVPDTNCTEMTVADALNSLSM